MKNFFVIANADKDKNLLITEKIARYIQEHGGHCTVQPSGNKTEGAFRYTDPEMIPAETECIIVLGGDGTLLQAARDLMSLDVPLLGINLGVMGFLAEVDRYSVYPALDRLLADRCELEERMMLTGTVCRGGRIIGEDIALNDIVISREGPLRVVQFHNYVNNEYLNSYNADGIIIATPTGSTGYSLSAGGPIVSPNAAMLIMTAVAPHTMTARSIVFPPEDVLTVELGEGRHNSMEKGTVSFDGDTSYQLVSGDRIVIRKAEACTRILKLNHLSFVEVLRQKMRDS